MPLLHLFQQKVGQIQTRSRSHDGGDARRGGSGQKVLCCSVRRAPEPVAMKAAKIRLSMELELSLSIQVNQASIYSGPRPLNCGSL
jgi:hypothetical protein